MSNWLLGYCKQVLQTCRNIFQYPQSEPSGNECQTGHPLQKHAEVGNGSDLTTHMVEPMHSENETNADIQNPTITDNDVNYARWIHRCRDSDLSSEEYDSTDDESDTPNGGGRKEDIWGVLNGHDLQGNSPTRRTRDPHYEQEKASSETVGSNTASGDSHGISEHTTNTVTPRFVNNSPSAGNIQQDEASRKVKDQTVLLQDSEKRPVHSPKNLRSRGKGESSKNSKGTKEIDDIQEGVFPNSSDAENFSGAQIDKGSNSRFKWTKGAKGKMANCGLYEAFPATDPNLVAFARYSRSIGYPERSVGYDIARVSRCLYFVQQQGLDDGEKPKWLCLDAINDTEPFSRYFQRLTTTLVSASVISHVNSFKRFVRYIDYERNRNGIRQYVIKHMDNYLTILLRGLERSRIKEHKVKRYSKEALTLVQPDIEFFRRKYKELLPEMEAAVNQYKQVNKGVTEAHEFIRPTTREFNDVTQYLMAVITVDHAQRPGVCENMTVAEVLNAHMSCNGKFYTVLVLEHKNASTKPATISYKCAEYKFLKKYYKYFRGPYMDGDEDKSTSRFFRNHHGKPFVNAAAKAVLRFHRNRSLPHISATQSRKAQETKNSKNLSREDRVLCNKYLSHSPQISEEYYEQPDIEDAVKARQLQLGHSASSGEELKSTLQVDEDDDLKSISEMLEELCPPIKQTLIEDTSPSEKENAGAKSISEMLSELYTPVKRTVLGERRLSENTGNQTPALVPHGVNVELRRSQQNGVSTKDISEICMCKASEAEQESAFPTAPKIGTCDRSISSQSKHTFGILNEAISEMVKDMNRRHISDDTPSREWLTTLTRGHPELVRESLVDALLYHHKCSKVSKLIGTGWKFQGVPAFKIISHIKEYDHIPTEADIVNMLTDMKVGNAGASRHHARESRSKMAAVYFSVLEEFYLKEQEENSVSAKTEIERNFSEESTGEAMSKKRKMAIYDFEPDEPPHDPTKMPYGKWRKSRSSKFKRRRWNDCDTPPSGDTCDAPTRQSLRSNNNSIQSKRKLDFENEISKKRKRD